MDKIESISPLVFISHASKDKEIIKLFVDNILKKGLNLSDKNIVFTSYEATGIVPGDNIPEYIKQNIHSADIVLAMISKNYKASEVCMNEVGAAWALDKTPIQIMLPNTHIDKLGWLIHLDKAAKLDDCDSLDSLMETICEKTGTNIPTAKHWNPCVRDFLSALHSIPNSYDKDMPECYLQSYDGGFEIECHPKFYRNNFINKQSISTTNNINEQIVQKVNNSYPFGFNNSLIATLNRLGQSPITTAKQVNKITNLSYCRIKLYLVNNSSNPIENGEILIFTNNKDIVFIDNNTENKNTYNIVIPDLRLNQSVKQNGVSESFKNPINPTATTGLYDFYIKAPIDISEFKLYWKLESLKEPKFGFINIKWIPEIEDRYIEVEEDDERINNTEIQDYLLKE